MGESYSKTETVTFYNHSNGSQFHQPNFINPPTISNWSEQDLSPRQNFISGSKNPFWRSQIRDHQNATTSMSAERFSSEGDGNYDASLSYDYLASCGNPITVGTFSTKASGVLGYRYPTGVSTPPGSVVAEVRNRCIRKFLDDAKSARSSFEAGQDLGEIKQTIESMIHPMDSLKKLTLGYFYKLKKVRNKYNKRRGNVSLRKALSDTYLEYRFGWRPLALDIADAYAGLTNRKRMTSSVPITSRASGQHSGSDGHFSPSNTLLSHMECNRISFSTYSMQLKGSVRLDLDPEGNIPFMQALQLDTLNDFAVTAWDLLPYSFVVDYFLNVGDCINAVTFPSSRIQYCSQTIRQISTFKYALRDNGQVFNCPISASKLKGRTLSGGDARLSCTHVDRSSIDPDSLIPKVRFSLPVSSRPWKNIGALISSNIRDLTPFYEPILDRKHLRETE